MLLFLVRFVAELFGIVALGYWGLHVTDGVAAQLLLGVVVPALLIVGWAAFVSPKSTGPVPAHLRPLLGTVIMLTTAVALATAGQPGIAVAFATIVVIDHVLLILIDPALPTAALAPRA